MKKRIFKKWVIEVLGTILASYFGFIMITIENLGNSTYNKVLIVWSVLTLVSFYLLAKYSDILEG